MRTDYVELLLKETRALGHSFDFDPPKLTWLASIGIPSACLTEGRQRKREVRSVDISGDRGS
jgi:hypothetical protein